MTCSELQIPLTTVTFTSLSLPGAGPQRMYYKTTVLVAYAWHDFQHKSCIIWWAGFLGTAWYWSQKCVYRDESPMILPHRVGNTYMKTSAREDAQRGGTCLDAPVVSSVLRRRQAPLGRFHRIWPVKRTPKMSKPYNQMHADSDFWILRHFGTWRSSRSSGQRKERNGEFKPLVAQESDGMRCIWRLIATIALAAAPRYANIAFSASPGKSANLL